MLGKIIAFFIRNKILTGLFIPVLIIYGVYEATRLPIDAVPDITDNQVQIITVSPSLGALDIERLITFPVEQANSNIPGIKEIRSFSRFGLSLVTIVFEDATDVYWARQQVAERLLKISSEIPPEIGVPELGPVTTGLGEIYQYVVRPAKGFEHQFDAIELRTIQDWYIRRQLLGVKGVAEVSSFGGNLKQYEVAIQPDVLQSLGLNINDVFEALNQNNQNTGGAYIEKGPTLLFIRSEGLLKNESDIASIVVKKSTSGMPITIGDIAKVKIGQATRYGALTYNNKGEVAGGVVMMLKGANSSEVIKNVKDKIDKIRQTLPEGVVLEPFLDRTKMVNNAIHTVEKNLLEGALIVIFVLVFFLGNFRAGFIVASVIPLSMLFAIIMMNTFGVSGNLMSLGALDFGLIVDGAVIIVEAVMHQMSGSALLHQKNELTKTEMDGVVKNAASKMMSSAVFGQIIILIVYIPILTLEGIEGKMFKPMAQTVAFALLGAFILSLTYVPVMSAVFLSRKVNLHQNISDRIMNRLTAVYRNALTKVVQYPKAVLGAVLVMLVLAIFTLSKLGGEFIPALEEGDFAVDTRVLTGSNLHTTINETQKAAGALLENFPEVEKVVTKIGSGEVPTDPMPIEASDMMVILKPKSEWTSASTFNELADTMGKVLAQIPGLSAGFQYPVQMRFNELMTGARQDVVCKIFGENLDSLALYSQKLGAVIGSVDGAQDVYIETVTGLPQIIITFDRPSLALYGVDIKTANDVINAALAGRKSGMVYEGEKRFDLLVRLDDERRSNVEDIRRIQIPALNGNLIPLEQIASVEIKAGPNQIQREDAKRRIIVGFNVRGRDVQSIVEELSQKVDAKLSLAPGYYITYGGAFENLEAAKSRLMIAVPVSLILIFILLYFAFGTFRQSLLIYSAIPLSAIGGIFFLAFRGMPFSISAGVGFIALFGVAVLNGIVLIAEFNNLRKNGEENLTKVVIEGTSLRLRPVLMTAFVASLGFLPMAVSNGSGAEVQRPLATVVIGGLLIATFLTLFVLPVLYILFENKSANMNVSKNVMLLIFFLLPALNVFSQPVISLNQALDSAAKNNLQITEAELMQQYREKLSQTAYQWQNTMFTSELGQFNSIYFDSKFSVEQTFSLPVIYSRQKDWLTKQWENSGFEKQIRLADIRLKTAEIFYYIQFLREKKKLLNAILLQNDSLFRKIQKRVEAGESNPIELQSALLQNSQAETQMAELHLAMNAALQTFQWLLNCKEKYIPEESDLFEHKSFSDSISIENLPLLLQKEHAIHIAKAKVALEKSLSLPEFSIAYNNMSIRGTGANNVFYDASKRFQSVQIGIGIPVSVRANKKRTEAAQVEVLIAENQLEYTKTEWQVKLSNALDAYHQQEKIVQTYRQLYLPGAEALMASANIQFQNGEINYLEYLPLIRQAMQTKIEYLNACHQWNMYATQLFYLFQN